MDHKSRIKKAGLFGSLLRVAILWIGLATVSSAQVIVWQKALGGSSQDYAFAMTASTDSGFVIAGTTVSKDGDLSGTDVNGNLWVVKLNSSGSLVWQKRLGGSRRESAHAITRTADGGYIIAGETNSNDGDVTGYHDSKLHEPDYWVVKLNGSGNLIWQKTLGGTKSDRAFAITATSDGGCLVAGQAESTDGDVSGHHGEVDFWVVKLNASGSIVWQKALGGSLGEVAFAVISTADGGYVVAGGADSKDGDVTVKYGNGDVWVVKLDSSGAIVWQKTLGGIGFDLARSITQTPDGGHVVAAETRSKGGDVSGHHGEEDFWVVKLNASGSMVWQKALGGSSSDLPKAVTVTPAGGYVMAGWTSSNDGDVSGLRGSYDFWVVKLNRSGRLIGQKTLGGTAQEFAQAVIPTANEGYVVAGYTQSNDGDVSGNHGAEDFWVVMLDRREPPFWLRFLRYLRDLFRAL